MKVSVRRENYLAIALLLVSLLLAGVLIWEWDQGLRLKQDLLKLRNIPAVSAKPLNILPEFTLPSEDAGFPELISRSMFAVNRRSTAVATKGGVSAMKKGQYILVGVLITPQQSSAQLRDVQTKRAETVALNGVIRGMTVGEVGPSRVVLRQGAESEELILNVQTGPKSPAAQSVAPIAVPPTVVQPAPPSAPVSSPSAPVSAPSAPPPEVTQQHKELKKK